MSVFVRIACIAVFAVFCGRGVYAAGVPVGDPLASAVPDTCEPEFWDVLKDRAWEEGQREITQNANIIARPDSVLSVSCFDSFLDDLSHHSQFHFPGNPDESEGTAGGAFTDSQIVAVDAAAYGSGGPLATNGYLMYAALELVVLDQLRDVTGDLTGLGVCGSKAHYIEDGFPEFMIGDRAIDEPPAPSWTEIESGFTSNITVAPYDGCPRMNDVWMRSKCYDFATESERYKAPPPGGEHDAFYSFETYESSGDFRWKGTDSACDSPSSNGAQNLPSAGDLACSAVVNSTSISLGSLSALFSGNSVPTWNSAFAGANPDPGSSGAMDEYEHFLGLRRTFDSSGNSLCSSITPIKTGYIVVNAGSSSHYVDAVCPAPGCYFNPPSSLGGTGSCD